MSIYRPDNHTYRLGRHNPQHIYRQLGTEASDDDVEIAVAFTEAAGRLILEALRRYNATPPRPSTPDDAPINPWAAQRALLAKQATDRALILAKSWACRVARPDHHCLGHQLDMNYGLGCLCECHDNQPDPASGKDTA